jgi:hypothetical protein
MLTSERDRAGHGYGPDAGAPLTPAGFQPARSAVSPQRLEHRPVSTAVGGWCEPVAVLGIARCVDDSSVRESWCCVGSVVEPERGIIMNDTVSSVALAGVCTDGQMLERLALVAFLAGYSGPTRESYRTDLRKSACGSPNDRFGSSTCSARTSSFTAAGSKTKEGRGRRSGGGCRRWPGSTATANRSKSSNAPRRRMFDVRSRTMSRVPWGWTATNSAPSWSLLGCHRTGITALASLSALNGLRISEALGADIEQLNVERGHRTLRIVRKGVKQVTIPLAPRTARASTWRSANGPTVPSSAFRHGAEAWRCPSRTRPPRPCARSRRS